MPEHPQDYQGSHLKLIEAMRAMRAAFPPPEPPHTLTDALEAARDQLISLVLDDISLPGDLAAQANAVEVLTRLAADDPDQALAELEARHTALMDAAKAVVRVVMAADMTREHFVGNLDGLADPLENLARRVGMVATP